MKTTQEKNGKSVFEGDGEKGTLHEKETVQSGAFSGEKIDVQELNDRLEIRRELYALLDQISRDLSQGEREALFRDIREIYSEKHPGAVLHALKAFRLFQKRNCRSTVGTESECFQHQSGPQ